MKEEYFKYTTLSFILINIWTSFAIFKYFLVDRSPLSILDIGVYFWFSDILAIGIGILLILIRIIITIKNRERNLRNNFFYIFIGLFNLNLFIVWLAQIIFTEVALNKYSILHIIGNFIIAAFVIADTTENKKERKNNK